MSSRTIDADLRVAAAVAADRPAVVTPVGTLTYGELDSAADRVARGLRSRGTERGDRVALLLANGLEAVVAIYGVLRAGAAISPLHSSVKAEKLAYVLAHSRARLLIADADRVEVALAAADAVGEVPVCEVGDLGWPTDSIPPTDLGRPRRDHLYLGLDGGAEGGDRQSRESVLRRRCDRRVSRDDGARARSVGAAAVIRLRAVSAAHLRSKFGRRSCSSPDWGLLGGSSSCWKTSGSRRCPGYRPCSRCCCPYKGSDHGRCRTSAP